MKNRIYFALCWLLILAYLPLHADTPEKWVDMNETVAILSFNDFHGAFTENKAQRIPGIARMVSCIKALKNKYDHSVVVSAGDNLVGSYFSDQTRAAVWKEVIKQTGFVIGVPGNHEFDWGKEFLKKSFADRDFYYTAINMTPKNAADNVSVSFWFLNIPLKNKKDTVIIYHHGLMTMSTKSKSGDRTDWFDMKMPMETVNKQKHKSNNLFILLGHIGTEMNGDTPVFMPESYNGKDCQLSKLPYESTYDAFITGHSHNEVHGLINGKPVVQAGCYGAKIGVIVYGLEKNQKNEIRFKYDTCYLEDVMRYNPDPAMKAIVDEWMKKPEYNFAQKLTYLNNNLKYGRENMQQFTQVGAHVTRSYADYYQERTHDESSLVYGISNYKGIRSGLSWGCVTKLDAGNILPLSGQLVAYELTGPEFIKLIENGINNSNGWIQTHDLMMQYSRENYRTLKVEELFCQTGDSYGTYLARFKDIPKVIVVLEKYLADGNDGYDKTLFHKPVEAFNSLKDRKKTTDVFFEYLEAIDVINKDEPIYPRTYQIINYTPPKTTSSQKQASLSTELPQDIQPEYLYQEPIQTSLNP